MAPLAIIGPIIGAVSSIVTGVIGYRGAQQQAAAQRAAGEQQKIQYEWQAKQDLFRADEARAAAQRDMLERRRLTAITMSKLQANASASGAGAADPSVVKLGEDISGQGEYGALMTMYSGESRGRGFEDQAIGARLSGEAAQIGGRAAARGTLLSGAGGLIGSFGSAAADLGKIKFG